MGPVTDVPLLERGSPETNRGTAVANPRIRVCSTVVSAAAPCHARSSGGLPASERIGDEHPCPRLLIPASVSPDGPAPAARTKAGHPSGLLTAGMNRDMRVDRPG